MTHADIVARAARWLSGSRGCSLVVTRTNGVTAEQPDAIGWHSNGYSLMVECKATVSDFRRDAKKWHRSLGSTGARRYYLVPAGLVRPADDRLVGWGLLWCYPAIVREVKPAPERSGDARRSYEEIRLLVQHCRREAVPPPATYEGFDPCL